jgi:peptide/nickel transport system substrate-binding protein
MDILDSKIEQKLIKKLFPKKWSNLKRINYLFKLLSQKEKKILSILSLITIFLILLLIFKISISQKIPFFKNKGYLIEGIIGQPQYVNPIFAKLNDVDLDLSRLIFSGLFKYDKDLLIVPDLAKSYEISPDRLTYKIKLKDNLYWHDDQKLTIDDVIFTFQSIQNPEFKNPFAEFFKDIKIVKKDDKNLEFILNKPNPYFLQLLTVGILPKHIWKNIPLKQFLLSDYNLKPIGSGPFKFKNLTRDEKGLVKSFVLERNKKYHGKIPELEKIIFRFYLDLDELIKAVQKREINSVYYGPKYLEKEFGLPSFLKKYSFKLPYYTALFFNLRNQNSFVSSLTIRKALAYSVPKEKILKEVFLNEGEIINSPILPTDFGYNPNLKIYEYNPEKAIKILENNGWQKNSLNYWEKENKILEISITTVDQPDLYKVGSLIQKAWQEIGIKTKLITLPAETLQKEIIPSRNFEVLLYGFVQTHDSDPYLLWHSSQIKPPGLNLTGFSNKRVDELLEKAYSVPFDEAKKRKYFEFQEIVNEELPAIFLYTTPYNYFVDKKIKGIEIKKINLPSDRFIGIENWHI